MSNVVPFRRPVRPWQCPHCQTWMLPGSITERLHGETPDRCPWHIARQAREAVRQEAEAIRAEWHRQDRERLRKARGVPIRRPGEPPPQRQPSQAEQARIDRLRKGLSDPEARERILGVTRMDKRQLSRVAAGRSTLGADTWRRVLEAIGGEAGR